MPKIGGKRKKARTHVEEGPEGDEIIGSIPKSLIFRRGKLNKPLKQVVQDFREIMYPYTTMKLKESEKTKIKDYIQASSVYGMTHMTILTSTESHNYIRFIKNPEGPTITFKIISYCTRRDILNSNKKNKCFSRQFQPAMLILNGFSKEPAANVRNPPTLSQQQIVAQMVQSMFPPLSLKKTKLSTLQRVILFSYDSEKDVVNMRHYHITLQPTGINKNIKKILKQDKKTPNLSKFNSFSDFVQAKKQISGFVSESDAEELPDSKVDVDQKSLISNIKQLIAAICFKEIGPRLKLRLYKIEEGLLRGNVVYNRRVVKTADQIETQRVDILNKQLEKEKRIKEQEKRVREKERLEKKKLREKAENRRIRQEERQKREEKGEVLEDEVEEEESEDEGVESDIEEEQVDEDQPEKNTKKKNKKGEDDSEDEFQDFESKLQGSKQSKNKNKNNIKNFKDEQSDEEVENDSQDDDDDEEDDDEDDGEFDQIEEEDEIDEGEFDDQNEQEEEEEIQPPPKKKFRKL